MGDGEDQIVPNWISQVRADESGEMNLGGNWDNTVGELSSGRKVLMRRTRNMKNMRPAMRIFRSGADLMILDRGNQMSCINEVSSKQGKWEISP